MIYVVSKQFSLFDSPYFTPISVESSIDLINGWEYAQFDTEGTGLDCHIAKILTLQFGSPDGKTQIVVDVTTIDIQLYKGILETCKLVGHNLKYDIKMLMAYGIIPRKVYDTMVAEQLKYLAYPKGMIKMSLKEVAKRYLDKDIDKSIRGRIKYVGITEDVVLYAANDVVDLATIMELQLAYFEQINALKAVEIECDFTVVCAYFEFCGVKLDSKKWMQIYEENVKEYKEVLTEINNFVVSLHNSQFLLGDLFEGYTCNINWNSVDDVVPLLKYLGFSTKGFNKKKKEETESKETKLVKKQKDKNPKFVELYCKLSKLQKLISTYGPQYVASINPKTGRIHTEFRALGTDTGRLACGSKKINEDLAELKGFPKGKDVAPELRCSYPQIQNLPNTDEVRSCFIAEEGNDFISIDYNSEESRLLASLSEDKGMLEVFEKGYDMHSYVAYLIYPEIIPRDVDIRNIKKDYHQQRQDAKGQR